MQLVDHKQQMCYNKKMIDRDFIQGVSTRYSTLEQLPNQQARIEDANTLRAMGCSVVNMIALSAEFPDKPELNRDKAKAMKALEVEGRFQGPYAEPLQSQPDSYFVPTVGYAIWATPETVTTES